MPLKPSQQQISQLAASYSKHRPHIQRALTVGFVLYVLGNTYNSLFARGSAPARSKGKGKVKGEDSDGKKPPRVAVRRSILSRFCSELSVIV